jgi:hypothetical protein
MRPAPAVTNGTVRAGLSEIRAVGIISVETTVPRRQEHANRHAIGGSGWKVSGHRQLAGFQFMKPLP